MRILLDTNIIVHREASKVYNQDIGLLFNWFDKVILKSVYIRYRLMRFQTYKDVDVVNTMKVKIEKTA
jgi:hypothetical protein